MKNSKHFGLLVFLFSLFAFISAHAQFIDSLQQHLSHTPSFFVKLDNRNTFVKNRTARVNGLDIGFSYNNRFRTGISLNQLTSSVTQQRVVQNETLSSRFAISFISYFVDYTYYQKKRISINMPLQLGIGMSYFYLRNDGKLRLLSKHYGLTYEASTIVTYSVFYWFSISSGLGYRLAFFNDPNSQNQFTAIIYSFGVSLYPNRLYKRLIKQ